MQTRTLWTLPCQSAALADGAEVRLNPRARAKIVIECAWFPQSDHPLTCALEFIQVSAFHVGFDFNSTSVLGVAAYDQLIEVIDSEWTKRGDLLHEGGESFKHRHFAISFEDGPWVEVLCEDFKVTTTNVPPVEAD